MKSHISRAQESRKCAVCFPQYQFRTLGEYADHLRTFHCAKEGGSYICRYGPHGFCGSLPLEGVSNGDYEKHLAKEHLAEDKHESSFKAFSSDQPVVVTDTVKQWTIHSSTQNLPAVLNDPRKTRREVAIFFTRHWGDSFVEKTAVVDSPLLPKIGHETFQEYHRTAKRYRRLLRNRPKLPTLQPSDLRPGLPKSSPTAPVDLSQIPKVFVNPKFNLLEPKFFYATFCSDSFDITAHHETRISPNRRPPSPVIADCDDLDLNNPFYDDIQATSSKTTVASPEDKVFDLRRNKSLQEKFAHFLDIVEVQIATQVASQSPAFFKAMASHDELQFRLSETKHSVQVLRQKLQTIDSAVVMKSLKVLRFQEARKGRERLHDKLKLMAAVREAQPNVHLCLASGDYLGALDLISTTQEILQTELRSVVAFRHLGSQLLEIQKFISKMLQEDFICYIQSILQKPIVEEDDRALEEQNLATLVLSLLRLKDFRVIAVLQQEIQSSLKVLIRQIVQDAVNLSESAAAQPQDSATVSNLAEQMRKMSFDEWMSLLRIVFRQSILFAKKVQTLQKLLCELLDNAVGKDLDDLQQNPQQDVGDDGDIESAADFAPELNGTDGEQGPSDRLSTVNVKTSDTEVSGQVFCRDSITELTAATVIFAQERVSRVLIAKAKDGSLERLPAGQFVELQKLVSDYVADCEAIAQRKVFVFQQAFQNLAVRFAARLHDDKKGKLKEILDIEYWKQARVPTRFQVLVDHISKSGQLRKPPKGANDVDEKSADWLVVNGERFVVIGTALLLLEMIIDYCQCVEDVPFIATELMTRLEDLLRYFNSRTCQLIIGAGAIETVGLKSISVRSVALASRCLQLIILYIPQLESHFYGILKERKGNLTKQFSRILEDYNQHVGELSRKLINVADDAIINQTLAQKWELRPPTPSPAFQQLTKQLKRYYDGISDILPSDQVQQLFFQVHTCFKSRLREQVNVFEISIVDNASYRFLCSEFSYYMEQLRQLPCCASFNETLKEVLAEK